MNLQVALGLIAAAIVVGFLGMFFIQGERLDAANRTIETLDATVKATEQRVETLQNRAHVDAEVRAMPPTKQREELMLWATP